MTIKEIIEKFSGLKIYEQRRSIEDYAEFVFLTEEINKWNKSLIEIFGRPVKPAGQKPSKDDLCLTKAYGGTRRQQVLFKKDLGGNTMIAMFWPWQDQIHITLKLALLKKG